MNIYCIQIQFPDLVWFLKILILLGIMYIAIVFYRMELIQFVSKIFRVVAKEFTIRFFTRHEVNELYNEIREREIRRTVTIEKNKKRNRN